jgi:chromosome segregation ATPase
LKKETNSDKLVIVNLNAKIREMEAEIAEYKKYCARLDARIGEVDAQHQKNFADKTNAYKKSIQNAEEAALSLAWLMLKMAGRVS